MRLDLASNGPRNTGGLREGLTLLRVASQSSHPFTRWIFGLVCSARPYEIKDICDFLYNN